MELEFIASMRPTLGVEVELQLVDHETRALVPASTPILDALASDGFPHPKAKHELLQCCVEVITGICEDVDEVVRDLDETLAEVRRVADPLGVDLLSAGSHPFSLWRDRIITDDKRYQDLVDELAWVARRMQIFGLHVHVGVSSGPRAMAVANGLCNYIPHLLALTASSPYWAGHDTGMASARSKVFEGLPTAGLPEHLDTWDDFCLFMGTLIDAGAIRSVREVWWDIRPHPGFGTVELRMCDGITNLTEIGAVTALAQCLAVALDRAASGEAPAPPTLVVDRRPDWMVRQNKWRAARHGLDADLIVGEAGRTVGVRRVLDSLVDDLLPLAAELGCASHLAEVRTMIERGSSADRQRAMVADGASLPEVVGSMVDELAAGHPLP